MNNRAGVLYVVLSLAISLSVFAEDADEHASHHPSAAGSSARMEDAGGRKNQEMFPSLIAMGDRTPEQRQQTERLARERMASGAALMATALERLNAAESGDDLAITRESAAQMRAGVLRFESGVAALEASAQGKAADTVALDWFKESMQLPSADLLRPHGFFGLSLFHYFTMFVLVAFALTMIFVSFRKMQRVQALAARLADAGPAPVPPAHPTEPRSPEDVSSKSNSWTGLLRVVKIFEETPNVRTLRLAHPSGGELPFRHLPGQFVTITVTPIDQPVKRSYTIASSPTRSGYCEVTVKREERGTVSSFLHHVHEGDTLQVTGPSGNFTFIGDGANSIVLISGGVGVTPMMSVLRYLTDRSWAGEIFFIFACRSDQDVIFREELEYLRRRHPNVHLQITADRVESSHWPYSKGPIGKGVLAEFVPHIATRRIHICGPKPMMDAVKSSLAELNVPAEQIKTEVFIGKERPAQGETSTVPAAVPDAPAQTQVAVATFARSRRTAILPPTKTVLEAAEDVGVNIDYSCRVGVCGICKVKLLKGAVTMDVTEGLGEKDRQGGMILACQAKCTADVTIDA